MLVEDGKRGLWWSDTYSIFENKMVLKGDGNLVMIDTTFNQERWSSNTGGKGSANTIFTMQDDGKAVLSCEGTILFTIKNEVSDHLVAPNRLATYQYLQSPNGKFKLSVGDHYLSIFEGDTKIWSTLASGNKLEMQMMDDDDFVVRNTDFDPDDVAWSTSLERPKPSKSATLWMQDNGVAVVILPRARYCGRRIQCWNHLYALIQMGQLTHSLCVCVFTGVDSV